MRKIDWQWHLQVYLEGVARSKFRPGKLDCALFTAGAVKAMTDMDYAKGWRGYKTLEAGRKKLSDAGFETHIEYAASLLPEVPTSMAHAGDVAVVDTPEGPALGIVQGEYVYTVGLNGLGLTPRTSATRAFKV